MNNLKDDLISKIFSYIDIQELLKIRRVNKLWNRLIFELNFEELVIIDGEREYENYEFYNFRPIRLDRVVSTCNQGSWKFFKTETTARQIFINLRFLKINFLIERDLEKINLFNQLVHLEIDHCEELSYVRKNVRTLYLPELKIFKFNNWYLDDNKKLDSFSNGKIGCLNSFFGCFNDDDKVEEQAKSICRLIIESKSLKILKCKDINQIRLANPLNLVHLESVKFKDNVKEFTNLEILKYEDLEIDTFILPLNLPHKLKEIHFHVFAVLLKDINRLKEIFESISAQKKIIKEKNAGLKFYFQGVEMLDDKEFDYYGFGDKNDLDNIFYYRLIKKNYDILADRLPMYYYIHYEKFEHVFHPLTDDLNRKLINIQYVLIDRINENADQLIRFLKSCPILSMLRIFYTDFQPEFFEELNNYHLKEFALECMVYDLNFDFILKFSLLKEFRTYEHVSIDVIIKALLSLRFLSYLRFYHFDTKIRIKKLARNSYNLYVNKKRPVLSNIKLNELIDLISDKIEEDNGTLEEDSSDFSCD